MKVAKLIEALGKFAPDAEVLYHGTVDGDVLFPVVEPREQDVSKHPRYAEVYVAASVRTGVEPGPTTKAVVLLGDSHLSMQRREPARPPANAREELPGNVVVVPVHNVMCALFQGRPCDCGAAD